MSNSSLDLVNLCATIAEDKKAEDPVIIKLPADSSVADYFLIVSGGTERHVKAIADGISSDLKDQGEAPVRMEGYQHGKWVIIDYADVIVHILKKDLREFYDLERLWQEPGIS